MRPPRPPGPSTRPALIVVAIAATLLVVGAVGAALTSGQSKPVAAPKSVPTAAGAGLHPTPARSLLAPIVSGGEPPDNVLDALVVPTGTTVVAGSASDVGVSLYDESLRFEAPASQQAILTFFRAELPAEHWQLIGHDSPQAGGGVEIIAQHPGSDGNEWELGVIVLPSTFAATANTGSADSTPVRLRLFVVSDDT